MESVLHGLFVHFSIYTVGQSVHCYYHLPKPPTFDSFVTYLAFIDAIDVTTPKMILTCWYQRTTISRGGCLTQLFLEHFLAGSEIIILIAIAYDHYVAICKPLHYTTIM